MTDGAGTNGKLDLSLDLPAAHRAVRLARNVAKSFARLAGMRDKDVDTLVLVVSELLANSVDHGGGESAMSEEERPSDVRMHLSLTVEGGTWTLRVTDAGGGDPDELRGLLSASGPPDLEDERGRGLFLMREMVDAIRVDASEDGRGLTITATKKHAYR